MSDKAKTIRIMAQIFVEQDGDEFYAWCPTLKGVHVGGATEKEALDNARHAVLAYLESLVKHDDPIPLNMVIDERPRRHVIRHEYREEFPIRAAFC